MSRIKRLWREPLVHFLLIGAGLFLVFGLTQAPGGKALNRIVVDASQVEQLAAQFSRIWLRPPTEAEMVGLIKDHVRDEVYYREALAMGLDQNDPVIHRRMRQKLEFILEDLSAEELPGDALLTAYLRQHADQFRAEPQVSFRQQYLNPDKHPNLAADAQHMLAELNDGAEPDSVGDPTMMQHEFTLATQSEIARSFGDAFARKVVELPPGVWTGPLFSGLGAHLVLVSERKDERLPELVEIRRQVEREYLAQRRQELKDMAYQKLLEGYQVDIEPTPTSGDAAGSAVVATGPEQAKR